MKDYYLVLGVSKNADYQKIKKAYRTIAKKSHPDIDHASESEERFKEITEAYDVLSDESKRKKYDNELNKRQASQRIDRENFTGIIERRKAAHNEMDRMFSYVDDFFEGFLPGLMEKERYSRKDLYVEIILTPEEALRGGLYPLTVPVVENCPRCAMWSLRSAFFCPTCYGSGHVRAYREFSLSIPPRVRHDTRIKLSLEDIGLRNTNLNVSVSIDHALEDAGW